MASATALETLPVELRGLASGVLQQGYAVGYLIAAVINLVRLSLSPSILQLSHPFLESIKTDNLPRITAQ